MDGRLKLHMELLPAAERVGMHRGQFMAPKPGCSLALASTSWPFGSVLHALALWGAPRPTCQHLLVPTLPSCRCTELQEKSVAWEEEVAAEKLSKRRARVGKGDLGNLAPAADGPDV